MKIGILRETVKGETRVSIIPAMIAELKKAKHEVVVESGAGAAAFFPDSEYQEAGASLVGAADEVYKQADVLVKVQAPSVPEIDRIPEGRALVGFLAPTTNRAAVERLAARKVTAFAVELIPRITRAQSMDALSSMSTVAGYKAVLLSTDYLGRFYPLLMTAAGTVAPANVLVLGAGVAGLQAIATAKRLGAKVEAFDVRPAVKEQIESLGARFVEMEIEAGAETAGGYAKEMSQDFIRREHEAIGSRLPRTDVVIATALIFGKRAPTLITEEMVKKMRPGSVIVDIAAEQGGNCALTKAGEVVQAGGVTIYGPVNLPAMMPTHASQMYSRNMVNLIKTLYSGPDGALNFEDEITRGSCVCRDGEIINDMVKKAFA
jgi:NAD(P) transhydrogenase subunit alpha